MKAHFTMFAAYNAWANRRLYEACASMSDEQRKAEAGAFFNSLHETLAHLVLADRIWVHRFTGLGPTPTASAGTEFDDFNDMRAIRISVDAQLSEYVAALTERGLERSMTYQPLTMPEQVTQPLATILAHVFNHQTHHRGQCHHMLTAHGLDAPPLDLLLYQLET
ncbi:MAG: DinB family protein [Pikeienuella sp.]